MALVPAGSISLLVGLRLLNLEQLIVVLVGSIVLLACARRATLMLQLLALVLPFQQFLLSSAFAFGLPAPIVRPLGFWKEAAAGGVIVAGWRVYTAARGRFDALDRLCLGFVLIGTVYLVGQGLIVGGSAAAVGMDARFVSWRSIVLPVLLLVAARHLRLSAAQVRNVMWSMIVAGALLGLVALYEYFASDSWNRFMVETIRVNQFRMEVLGIPADRLSGRAIYNIRSYSSADGSVRIGGPMLSYLEFAFVLVLVLAVQLEWLVRTGRAARFALAPVLAAFGLIATQTRSAIVGAGVVLGASVRAERGRSTEARLRYASVIGVLLVLAVPAVLASGLADRFLKGDATSDEAHASRFDEALIVPLERPMGSGLGTGSAGTNRGEIGFNAENQFIDVAQQLGTVAMLIFSMILLLLIWRLHAVGKESEDPDAQFGTFAMRGAVVGMLIPCWYLNPLALASVSWVMFALAGAALGAAEAERVKAATA